MTFWHRSNFRVGCGRVFLCSLSPRPSLPQRKGDSSTRRLLGLTGAVLAPGSRDCATAALALPGNWWEGTKPRSHHSRWPLCKQFGVSCGQVVFLWRAQFCVSAEVTHLRSGMTDGSERGQRLHSCFLTQSKSWYCEGQGKTSHRRRVKFPFRAATSFQ